MSKAEGCCSENVRCVRIDFADVICVLYNNSQSQLTSMNQAQRSTNLCQDGGLAIKGALTVEVIVKVTSRCKLKGPHEFPAEQRWQKLVVNRHLEDGRQYSPALLKQLLVAPLGMPSRQVIGDVVMVAHEDRV